MRVSGFGRGALVAAAVSVVVALAPGPASTAREASAQQGPPQQIQDALVSAFLAEVGTTQIGILIERYTPVTWAHGCMGIGEGDVSCTQALVDGWVLWVVSDNTGYRFHANLDGSVMRLAAVGIAIDTIDVVGLPSSATLRLSGGYTGATPGRGQLGLLVTSGVVSADQLVSALASSGCTARSLVVLQAGVWRVHIPGAPTAVNAAFPSALVSGTPFAVRCG